jgi:hypothetical protein
MFKLSSYIIITCFPTYIRMQNLFPTKLVTKVKPNINSLEVHPQLNNNGHLVDGMVVGVNSLWP